MDTVFEYQEHEFLLSEVLVEELVQGLVLEDLGLPLFHQLILIKLH